MLALSALTVAAQTPPVVKTCGLLPRAEVKTLIGGNASFDRTPPREEPLGSHGSSCVYPDLMIQVLPFVRQRIDVAKQRGGLTVVYGVGDEAYLYDNRAGYAELYAKVGRRLLVVQRRLVGNGSLVEERPKMIALAKALAAKLK